MYYEYGVPEPVDLPRSTSTVRVVADEHGASMKGDSETVLALIAAGQAGRTVSSFYFRRLIMEHRSQR
eukprot:scaffold22945_cov21-Prasinocladus_malaysianus.AAC.1